MENSNTKQQAQNLRKYGLSYELIASRLGIAKSTSYVWLKDIKLGSKALKRLEESQIAGRLKGHNAIRTKSQQIDNEIKSSVIKKLDKIRLTSSVTKLLCAFLYWGEGEKSKNKIAFTNSDPEMVGLFLKLFRKSFEVKEEKFSAFLHLHKYHNRPKQISFWSRITGIHKNKIHVYNKESFGKFKKDGYRGCISIRYNNFRIAKEIAYWYKIFTSNSQNYPA